MRLEINGCFGRNVRYNNSHAFGTQNLRRKRRWRAAVEVHTVSMLVVRENADQTRKLQVKLIIREEMEL